VIKMVKEISKSPKNISLDSDVAFDVSNRVKLHGFVFSDYVNRCYRRDFMSGEYFDKEIKECKERIKYLEEQKENSKILEESFKESFSRDEVRFMRDVSRMLQEGKDLKSITKRFNVAFNRDLSCEDFKRKVNIYGKMYE